jgi:hypothetical protein
MLPDPSFQFTAQLAAPTLEHTVDHRDCPACLAQDNEVAGVRVDFAALPFTGAAEYWLKLRAQSMSLKPRTHEATRDYLHALEKFFSRVRLREISPGHLRAYQAARLHNSIIIAGRREAPWGQPAGHSRINHEISALGQMLGHCRLWHRLKPFYFPLPVDSWSPRSVLSEEAEERLFQIASRHPEARLAYLVATVTSNTGAAGIELRGLRLRHVSPKMTEYYSHQRKRVKYAAVMAIERKQGIA